LAERVSAVVSGGRQLMERTSDVIAVAQQAAPIEPLIAAAARAGREATRDGIRLICSEAETDGLLPPGTDVEWLGNTLSLLAGPDAHLLITETLGWNPEAYQDWYHTTWEPVDRRRRDTERGPELDRSTETASQRHVVPTSRDHKQRRRCSGNSSVQPDHHGRSGTSAAPCSPGLTASTW
jgi:hypothetical protein